MTTARIEERETDQQYMFDEVSVLLLEEASARDVPDMIWRLEACATKHGLSLQRLRETFPEHFEDYAAAHAVVGD